MWTFFENIVFSLQWERWKRCFTKTLTSQWSLHRWFNSQRMLNPTVHVFAYFALFWCAQQNRLENDRVDGKRSMRFSNENALVWKGPLTLMIKDLLVGKVLWNLFLWHRNSYVLLIFLRRKILSKYKLSHFLSSKTPSDNKPTRTTNLLGKKPRTCYMESALHTTCSQLNNYRTISIKMLQANSSQRTSLLKWFIELLWKRWWKPVLNEMAFFPNQCLSALKYCHGYIFFDVCKQVRVPNHINNMLA